MLRKFLILLGLTSRPIQPLYNPTLQIQAAAHDLSNNTLSFFMNIAITDDYFDDAEVLSQIHNLSQVELHSSLAHYGFITAGQMPSNLNSERFDLAPASVVEAVTIDGKLIAGVPANGNFTAFIDHLHQGSLFDMSVLIGSVLIPYLQKLRDQEKSSSATIDLGLIAEVAAATTGVILLAKCAHEILKRARAGQAENRGLLAGRDHEQAYGGVQAFEIEAPRNRP